MIKFKRGTDSNWKSKNPVLSAGQPGYDSTNNSVKIGDGSTAWNSKDYISANLVLNKPEGNINLNELTKSGLYEINQAEITGGSPSWLPSNSFQYVTVLVLTDSFHTNQILFPNSSNKIQPYYIRTVLSNGSATDWEMVSPKKIYDSDTVDEESNSTYQNLDDYKDSGMYYFHRCKDGSSNTYAGATLIVFKIETPMAIGNSSSFNNMCYQLLFTGRDGMIIGSSSYGYFPKVRVYGVAASATQQWSSWYSIADLYSGLTSSISNKFPQSYSSARTNFTVSTPGFYYVNAVGPYSTSSSYYALLVMKNYSSTTYVTQICVHYTSGTMYIRSGTSGKWKKLVTSGNTAANTADIEVETGTFTLSGTGYNNATKTSTCNYYKNGRQVIVSGNTPSWGGTIAHNIGFNELSGLPFAPAKTAIGMAFGSLNHAIVCVGPNSKIDGYASYDYNYNFFNTTNITFNRGGLTNSSAVADCKIPPSASFTITYYTTA